MKKKSLIKSSGLYCINFEFIHSAETHISNGSYKVLLFNNTCEDPVFILYYKDMKAMERAYRNILGIIEGNIPGKVIKVNFGKNKV